jgi:hypothetical protein
MNLNPEAAGMQLALLRAENPDILFHVLADRINWDGLPEFSNNDSMVIEQAKKYQLELKQRALNGDRYAISSLNGSGYHEPADE